MTVNTLECSSFLMCAFLVFSILIFDSSMLGPVHHECFIRMHFVLGPVNYESSSQMDFVLSFLMCVRLLS